MWLISHTEKQRAGEERTNTRDHPAGNPHCTIAQIAHNTEIDRQAQGVHQQVEERYHEHALSQRGAATTLVEDCEGCVEFALLAYVDHVDIGANSDLKMIHELDQLGNVYVTS